MNGSRNDFASDGPKQQELRRHRIEDVRRRDAAVRVIFLAELQRLPVGVGDELAGGEALPIRQRRDRGVLLAPRGIARSSPSSTSKLSHRFMIAA